ncbi:hypothetical protein SHJG_4724 [Streptomyces hygroscopicus subsp. jinggangensis 5008]|nr:hypothetical protein SHJG_4724 [Streptomyces hygroscopicus subsp. jinggangensis 5008]AGF64150.1 hypothetical protein SHJGH_4486 [Streptomyces hygroscopicus subsp. jinggangensis TL01]
MYATEVQRLTTAPPWRHAPRFFLAGRLVANPVTIGVSHTETSQRGCISAGAVRTTPPDCR